MRNLLIVLLLTVTLLSCNQSRYDQVYSEQKYNESLNRMSQTDSLSYVFQNEYLSLDSKVIDVFSKDEWIIRDLIIPDRIFLYISDIQCNTCIDQELDMIKKFYKSGEIILLCKYQSERDLKLYLKLNKFEYPSYFIKSEVSSLMERFTSPVYFRLSSEAKPTSVFFASISTPDKSIQYHTLQSNFPRSN